MAESAIQVEVVHAGTGRLWRRCVSLPAGSTAMQAVEAAGWLQELPANLPRPLQLGIHSRRVGADHVLRDGDRVEIYRPLALDPMASRRRRAGEA
jgi:putative ubiquitin-RnfH superfamily antitoxin RatB of RatAB toxin-antitoxin module